MTENDREGGGEATNVPSQTGDESQWHSRSFQLYQHHILYMVVLNEFSIPSFHENGDVQYCFIILSNSDHAGLKGERIKLKFEIKVLVRFILWAPALKLKNKLRCFKLTTQSLTTHCKLFTTQWTNQWTDADSCWYMHVSLPQNYTPNYLCL